MKNLKNIKGVTLVELMVTLVVFSIIFSMIYSVYNNFIRIATVERKSEKTELDIIQNSWSLIKTIENAGLGIPPTGACAGAISLQGGELVIHSTGSGADRYAGRWGRITGDDCTVPDLSDLNNGEYIVILAGEHKNFISFGQISTGKITPCDPDHYKGHFAFWVPNNTFGCYEIRFRLGTYNPGTTPTMCENTGAMVLRRSLSTTAQTNYEPFIDCVFGTDPDGDTGLNFRFGCIDDSGNLTWRTDHNCGTAKLRIVKVGILVQASPRKDIQGPPTISFFEDLDPSLRVTINLNDEQRFYRWKKLEQTIILRNPA